MDLTATVYLDENIPVEVDYQITEGWYIEIQAFSLYGVELTPEQHTQFLKDYGIDHLDDACRRHWQQTREEMEVVHYLSMGA